MAGQDGDVGYDPDKDEVLLALGEVAPRTTAEVRSYDGAEPVVVLTRTGRKGKAYRIARVPIAAAAGLMEALALLKGDKRTAWNKAVFAAGKADEPEEG